ncbi:hypothetical protein M427DRAFT_426846 [Gonapodya prolifera JEL478]|uniref:Uncharacterized protein n=1 Tax=Gonapodya prolifera (strain JEL478) TaxID=1344416 RepID=A0A139ASM3_GONPJ|nr:hypothetical protein M427DRAFT_426846 [Gonapodya prolifera JEL478]|eukprot:KXS19654.1 hypothetical protein M427DRAFT_426846 [Gonapodya prolifera JEL478]
MENGHLKMIWLRGCELWWMVYGVLYLDIAVRRQSTHIVLVNLEHMKLALSHHQMKVSSWDLLMTANRSLNDTCSMRADGQVGKLWVLEAKPFEASDQAKENDKEKLVKEGLALLRDKCTHCSRPNCNRLFFVTLAQLNGAVLDVHNLVEAGPDVRHALRVSFCKIDFLNDKPKKILMNLLRMRTLIFANAAASGKLG